MYVNANIIQCNATCSNASIASHANRDRQIGQLPCDGPVWATLCPGRVSTGSWCLRAQISFRRAIHDRKRQLRDPSGRVSSI